MSRRNREAVQAAFDAYYRGDMRRVAEFADPDLVVTQTAEMPDAETFHGRRGFIEAIDTWKEAWDDFRVERLSTRDIGDHVLTTVRQRARGKRSGVEVEGLFTFVFTLKAGRLVRWRMFADEENALEAVGLQPLQPAGRNDALSRPRPCPRRTRSPATCAGFRPSTSQASDGLRLSTSR